MKADMNFLCHPTICAVEDTYQILTPVTCPMTFQVEIAGKVYSDHYGGILRSNTDLHRVTVPMKALDEAGAYTVIYRKVIDRKPYFPEFEPAVRITYPFRPVPTEGPINIYMIADAHGMIEAASSAGTYFGENLDLLILNGDIADHSGTPANIMIAYQIASNVTEGTRPVIFSRGNHDNRGAYAEKLPDYTPNWNGKTYYTIQVGPIWAALIDCGEDKVDTHEEYGGTICFSVFREEEEAWLNQVATSRKYAEFPHRFVISHVPFAYNNMRLDGLFNIEEDRYTRWCALLRDTIQPELMLSGHLHQIAVGEVGGNYDDKGQPCPIVVGSLPDKEQQTFIGTALTLYDKYVEVRFTDQDHQVAAQDKITF